jgi:hypothetical protein
VRLLVCDWVEETLENRDVAESAVADASSTAVMAIPTLNWLNVTNAGAIGIDHRTPLAGVKRQLHQPTHQGRRT